MDMVAAVFRTIFAQPDPESMTATWDRARDQLTARIPKIGPHMDAAKVGVLAFNTSARAHWRRMWSTNPLERLNKEIKRRARVVETSPNEACVIRLVGMMLADTNDEWITDERRCLSEGSMAGRDKRVGIAGEPLDETRTEGEEYRSSAYWETGGRSIEKYLHGEPVLNCQLREQPVVQLHIDHVERARRAEQAARNLPTP